MWKIHFIFILSFCVFAHAVTEEDDLMKIGDDCESQEDCENISNATCNSSEICECTEGYVASSDKLNCLPLAEKIGDICDVPEQCSSVPHTECIHNKCTLKEVPITPKAITLPPTTVPSKEECTKDSDCSSFLLTKVCKDGTCVVGLPSISPKSLQPDILVLGKICNNDTDCPVEGSGCIEKLCKCKDNFVVSRNLKMCLPKAKSVGDKCVETTQCLPLNGSVCENEKCTEKITKFLNSFNEKIPPLLIGSSCQTDKECKHLTHALCLENVCQCTENYIPSLTSSACLEIAKKEGDPCEIDKQCEGIKQATCIQKKCVKPGVIGAKLGKQDSGASTLSTVSKVTLASILLIKTIFV